MASRALKNALYVLVFVLFAGVLISVGLSWISLQFERSKLRNEVQDHLLNHLVAIEDDLRSNVFVLDALAAYFDADEEVSRPEFQAFAASLLRTHTTIQALEWLPRIPHAERRAYEERARQDDLTEHGIVERDPQGRMIPAGERADYFPVYFVEPLKGNEPAILYDPGSDAKRGTAMLQARDTGEATATGRIVLVQETGDQYGFILFKPIYRKDRPRRTVEERRRELAGFVVSVFRIGDIVSHAMAPLHTLSAGRHMDVLILDTTAPAGERLLYPKTETVEDSGGLHTDIRVFRSFDVGGRRWLIEASPTAVYEQSKKNNLHWVVLAAGLAATLLFTSLVWMKMRRTADRMAAEAALRQGETLLRSILDNSQNEIVLKDSDGRYLIANAAFLRQTDIPDEDLAGETLPDLSPKDPEVRRLVAEHEWEVITARQPIVKEHEWPRGDGRLATYLVSKFPVLDDTGRVIRIGSIATDITERKKAERELLDLNRAYRTLSRCNEFLVRSDSEQALIADVCRTVVETGGYASAAVGIVGPDDSGPIYPAATFGRLSDAADVAHIPWDDPDCPMVAAFRTRTVQVVGGTIGREACGRFANMLTTGLFKTMAAFPLVSGSWTIGVLVVFGDSPGTFGKNSLSLLEELASDLAFGIVALRTKASNEMATAEMRKLARAVEQSPATIVITNAEGVIEYVNPKFIEVTGFSVGEALGQKPSLLKSGELEPKDYEALWRTIKSGKEWRGLFHNRRKDGSLFWGETAISPVFDRNGDLTHFIGIQEDVTERLQNERRLRHADKMDSLGNMAGGIAHDFNNMLLPIGTLTAMVLKDTEPGSKARQRLERVVEATQRAQSLAQRILSFCRTGDGQVQAQGISEVTTEAVNLLKSTLSKTITLDIRIEPDVGTVECDRAQVETVILNLAKNAADAMGRRAGELRIALERLRLARPLTGMISTIQPGGYARLTLSDTGSGIGPDKLGYIFEPFFTTKAKGEGTGLGLPMVRTIVLKLGGTIVVESEVGVGTTFQIYFPLQDEGSRNGQHSGD